MRTKFFAILLSLLALSGCGVVSQVQNYRAVDDYRDCLAAHPSAVEKCEATRLSMVAAGRKLSLPADTDITVRPNR